MVVLLSGMHGFPPFPAHRPQQVGAVLHDLHGVNNVPEMVHLLLWHVKWVQVEMTVEVCQAPGESVVELWGLYLQGHQAGDLGVGSGRLQWGLLGSLGLLFGHQGHQGLWG